MKDFMFANDSLYYFDKKKEVQIIRFPDEIIENVCPVRDGTWTLLIRTNKILREFRNYPDESSCYVKKIKDLCEKKLDVDVFNRTICHDYFPTTFSKEDILKLVERLITENCHIVYVKEGEGSQIDTVFIKSNEVNNGIN